MVKLALKSLLAHQLLLQVPHFLVVSPIKGHLQLVFLLLGHDETTCQGWGVLALVLEADGLF